MHDRQSPDGVARCLVPGADRQVAVAPDALLTLDTPHGTVLFQDDQRAPGQGSGGSNR
jgi:hypothetical protein